MVESPETWATELFDKQEWYIDWHDGNPPEKVDKDMFFKKENEAFLLFSEATIQREGNKNTLLYNNRIIN